MQGRPRKLSIVSTGKIGKEEKQNRAMQEEKIKAKDELKAPSWLTKDAKKEFKRIVELSRNLKLLDDMDISILAIYSQAYSDYISITKELQSTDDRDYRPKLYRLQKMQIETIMQCSGKLGLAISDRLRLVIPKKEEKKDENPYAKYL